MTACRFHCRCCGGHFASLEAFDAHRSGSMDARRCDYPDDAELVERAGGSCSIAYPAQPAIENITVYSTKRADRARDAFGTRAGRQGRGAKLSGGIR